MSALLLSVTPATEVKRDQKLSGTNMPLPDGAWSPQRKGDPARLKGQRSVVYFEVSQVIE